MAGSASASVEKIIRWSSRPAQAHSASGNAALSMRSVSSRLTRLPYIFKKRFLRPTMV